ncbi:MULTISPECIES: hypothetical protein [Amycolatopsis]|uniref:Uncharacterized protein n=1 Tax=Amycolatopsis albispora TaxID=1804986 RepID=A0A344KZS5_9PSEU|nr:MULTISPECIES: hypothetical protein [Amycolatopsis]AXB41299.1 hypothetical protein A4R43_01180 [Amycolatopsis albispora]
MKIRISSGTFVAPVEELTGAFPPMFSNVTNRMSEADTRTTKRILLFVELRNTGRSPIEVNTASIEVGPQGSSIPFLDKENAFPLKLEPASTRHFKITAFEALNILTRGKIDGAGWFTAVAHLGDGSTVRAEKLSVQATLDAVASFDEKLRKDS